MVEEGSDNPQEMGTMVSALPQQPGHPGKSFKPLWPQFVSSIKWLCCPVYLRGQRREDLVKTTFYILCGII